MEGLATTTTQSTFMNSALWVNKQEQFSFWNIRTISYFIFFTISSALIFYIVLQNLAPFGISDTYSLTDNNNISPLGPRDRVENIEKNNELMYKLTADHVYFSTNMPFAFDTAKVKVIYQNTSPEQEIQIGYRDQNNWHYDTKTLDVPFLDLTEWSATGKNPYFYQKKKQYDSFIDFQKHPPQDALLGVYNFDDESFYIKKLPHYKPQLSNTTITNPIRGSVTMYAYVENEPFEVEFEKQELNWNKGSDTTTLKVYKGNIVVYEKVIADDGITDDSRRTTPSSIFSIKNPGPGLPESGVYKIEIETSSDTVFKRITTNLHKLVFGGKLFLAGNADVYPTIVHTIPTTLYTNAILVTVLTPHQEGLQRITSGNKALRLTEVNEDGVIIPQDPLADIVIPKNDIIIDGMAGYFAFEKQHFFQPSNYKLLHLSAKTHVDLVDYIVMNHEPARQEGNWRIAEHTFDISKGYIDDGKLHWMLYVPGLEENEREILIKDIEIMFNKKPILE